MTSDWLVDRLQRLLWVEEALEQRQHALTLRVILVRLGAHPSPRPDDELPAADPEHGQLGIAEAALATAHRKVAAYTLLRTAANALGEDEIGLLLQELLDQERYALELAEKAAAKLLAETVTNAS